MEKGRNLTGLDGWFGDGRKVPSPGAVLMLLWWSWHEEAMGGKLLVTKPISFGVAAEALRSGTCCSVAGQEEHHRKDAAKTLGRRLS